MRKPEGLCNRSRTEVITSRHGIISYGRRGGLRKVEKCQVRETQQEEIQFQSTSKDP